MAFYRESERTISREYALRGSSITQFQTQRAFVDIVPTQAFGEMLFVDNELQLAARDEYIYHEMLVHPALSASASPRRVCILGGGDGCAAREVLKWPSVEQIDLIDWDADLVCCFLHSYMYINRGSLENLRVRPQIADIRTLVGERRQYDVMIVDLLDPKEEDGESQNLWSDIASLLRAWLAPQGIVVLNVGGILPWKTKVVEDLIRLFRQELQFADPYDLVTYKVFVPSFAEEWCFLLIKPRGAQILGSGVLPPAQLSYFDETAWHKAVQWTRDYQGKIPFAPVNLTVQAHL